MGARPLGLRVPEVASPDHLVEQLALTARQSRPSIAGRGRLGMAVAAGATVLLLSVGGAWASGAIDLPGLPDVGGHTPQPGPGEPATTPATPTPTEVAPSAPGADPQEPRQPGKRQESGKGQQGGDKGDRGRGTGRNNGQDQRQDGGQGQGQERGQDLARDRGQGQGQGQGQGRPGEAGRPEAPGRRDQAPGRSGDSPGRGAGPSDVSDDAGKKGGRRDTTATPGKGPRSRG
jgi:hypothetical protein